MTITLKQGDCLESMKLLTNDSIDAICSDPPYQLSSTSVVRARPDQTKEGSYGKEVPFSRVQSRIPKSGFMGKDWDVLPSIEILKECCRVLKPGAFALWLMTPRQDSQMEFLSRLRQAGFVISFSPIYWAYASGFPKASNVSKLVDKRLGAQRMPTGKDKKRSPVRNDYGIYGLEWDRKDLPATTAAAALNGAYCGFQPKPAVEVIIVSMKPLSEKTYIAQAMKNGKGITWFDNCRIPFQDAQDAQDAFISLPEAIFNQAKHPELRNQLINKSGRFPANLLVSDNVLDTGKTSTSTSSVGGFGAGVNTFGAGLVDYERGYNDTGDFSRYFSLDEWWRVNFEELPKEQRKTFPFLIVPKANKGERNEGLDKFEERNKWLSGGGVGISDRENIKARNIHPTVKPIDLMSYLITLTTREGEIVLDPFIGSGTTAIAAYWLDRNCIGYEREFEYFKIANARIAEAQAQSKLGL